MLQSTVLKERLAYNVLLLFMMSGEVKEAFDTLNFLGLCLFLVSALCIEEKSIVVLLCFPLILEKESKQVKKPQEFFVKVKN